MAGFADKTNAWTQAWLDMQKQYMDTWMKFSREGLPGSAMTSPLTAAGKGPWGDAFGQWSKLFSQGMPGSAMTSPFTAAGPRAWGDAFEQWSKLFSQGMPASASDVSTRLFDLGKSYLDMSERFWQLLQQGKAEALSAEDWQAMLQQACEQAGKGFGFPGGATDPWSGFATLWGLPLSNWQRMACSFSPFPGEMEKALRPDHVPEPSVMTRAMRHYLSLPPVGYTREWQEQQQEWTELFMEYARTLQAFGGLLGKVVQRALDLFGKRMSEKVRAGESFDGLRAIYDFWIDCGEEAYAEEVATAEFPRLQADMINALMRMKRQEQLMVEELMTALNMPTRREMDTTHKRVYELQQQVSRLQDALEEAADAGAAPPETRKTARTRTRTAAHRAKPKTGKGDK